MFKFSICYYVFYILLAKTVACISSFYLNILMQWFLQIFWSLTQYYINFEISTLYKKAHSFFCSRPIFLDFYYVIQHKIWLIIMPKMLLLQFVLGSSNILLHYACRYKRFPIDSLANNRCPIMFDYAKICISYWLSNNS